MTTDTAEHVTDEAEELDHGDDHGHHDHPTDIHYVVIEVVEAAVWMLRVVRVRLGRSSNKVSSSLRNQEN